MKVEEALELYKGRDASEKLFKADKTFLGNRSMGGHTGNTLEGKMLIAFVDLIIRNRMYTKLKDEKEKAALAELVKMRNEQRKEELMNAVINSDKSYEENMAFERGEMVE